MIQNATHVEKWLKNATVEVSGSLCSAETVLVFPQMLSELPRAMR
jgi:hypothetical protein